VSEGTEQEAAKRAAEARRRRRADEVFGTALPATTSDEREPDRPRDEDEWYLRNRPPHHGG
jgi:hypothetical protein